MTTALRKVFTTVLVVHYKFKNLPIYCLCPLFKHIQPGSFQPFTHCLYSVTLF